MSNHNPETIGIGTLLTARPPGRIVLLDSESVARVTNVWSRLVLPELLLWCPDESCCRDMLFELVSPAENPEFGTRESFDKFVTFRCKHCEMRERTYAIRIIPEAGSYYAVKLGEFPPFGKPIPPSTNKLLEAEDRVWLIKGLRSEEHGFGIGAFGYFRRVIEQQWARLLARIIQVAEKTQADRSLIDHLHAAAAEQQFAKSIEMTKAAIPPVLLIDGHNPISLLHSSLSEGLHAEDDDHCLELATSIREVLYALAQRMSDALKKESTLNEALGRLHQRRQSKLRVDGQSDRQGDTRPR